MNASLLALVTQLGLKRAGREWRGVCPACGYGNGAFVLSAGRNGRPLLWCASCQDRDAIGRVLGGAILSPPDPADAARQAAAKSRKTERALALWHGASAIATPCTGGEP